MRLGAAAGAACLAAALSGCATVPTSGPIVEGAGRGNAAGQDGTYVRQIPAGPQRGVDEAALVKGFLKDMGSVEDDYRAPRMYMTPEKQATWRPDGTVLVYGEIDAVGLDVATAEGGETATVRMRTEQVATIEASGQYVPATSGQVIDVTFDLVKVEGEWRIAELPQELVLSRRDVDRVYRPLNLYFFNRDMGTLVPDPVLLPVQSTTDLPDQLSRLLARMLVSGPTEWLQPAVRSAFPPGTNAAVAYDTGHLTVELTTGESEYIGSEQRVGMAAQLVWTLKQLPEVQELTLRLDGEEIEVPGSQDEGLQIGGDYWNSVNPSGVNGALRSYFVRDGQLWSLDSSQQEARVEGAAGVGGTPLEQHAVSLDERWVAGITAGHHRVVTTEMVDGSEYAIVLDGGDYTALSWDGYGNLWAVEDISSGGDVAERADAEDVDDDTEPGDTPRTEPSPREPKSPGTRLWMLPGGSDPVQVNAPELAGRTVTQLRASRDGTRVAVLVGEGDGTRLLVGRVVHADGGVALEHLIPLAMDLDHVSDIAWRGADQLAVLGRKERGALQAYLVSLDGSTESTSAGAAAGSDMKTIAAAPGQPLLAGVEDDYLSMTNDRLMWQRVTDGANPVYPG
ncbi:Sporulation and spore germination [Marinactinospora thermotolerans DSM 45154]|uniref:Lipoprotein LpqB n=2 Tax=Marinactinospora thermotolerans TaxID=531310 RepID=A0A1T4QKV0_9ACTN|nr:Sporulation and spore germination [Marinactinospora thermotolerans DSM 45154]